MGIFDFLNASQTGTQDVTTTIDPQVKAAYLANLKSADQVAARPYQQYQGPRIAGFNQDQTAMFDKVRGMMNGYQPFINQAQSAIQSVMNMQPSQISYSNPQAQGYGVERANASTVGSAGINRGGIRDVQGGSFLGGNINAYMNPYTSSVIDQTMQDLNRQKTLDRQNLSAQAARSGAFGGTRQAVAEQELNRNYADQFARTSSQLRNQGFDTASNLMQSDLNRGLQAQGQNQQADLSVANSNAGFMQQSNLANQSALNNMSQFNATNQNAANNFLAGARNNFAQTNALQNMNAQQQNVNNQLAFGNQRLTAGNNMANLGQVGQSLGLNAASAMGNIGNMQQGQVQKNYDLANQDFKDQWNYPLQQLAIRQGALQASLPEVSKTVSTPLYENQLGNILGALGGINSITNNGSGGIINKGIDYLGGLLGSKGGGSPQFFTQPASSSAPNFLGSIGNFFRSPSNPVSGTTFSGSGSVPLFDSRFF